MDSGADLFGAANAHAHAHASAGAAEKTAGARKVRALFLNDTSRNGGPGRTLFYILKFLDPAVLHRAVVVPREGIVSQILLEGGVTEELFFEPRLVENIVEPWDRAISREDFAASSLVRGTRAVGNVLRATGGMASLARLVKRGGYEVIFCNGTSANFAGAALSWLTGVPAVWHVFYTSVAKPIARLHADLAASKGVKAILCVSEPTTRMFGHCTDKVRIVHDAIDVEEFDGGTITPQLRAELGVGADTVIFGSQGRILPRKGYLEMVRAAKVATLAMTADERTRCRFVVLGDTPQDMRPDHLEECRAVVRDLGLTDTFLFLGYRPNVKPYIADVDVAVVPSVYEDPLPRSVLESMALGKPVIAFDVGGIGEMVDASSGALVRGSPPDIDGLAAAFLRYLRDPALREAQGLAARARVERKFDARGHAHLLQEEIVRASAVRGALSAPR